MPSFAPVAVRLTDSFWKARQAQQSQVSLLAQWEHLESTGRIENFRRAAKRERGGFQGRYYNDSDVYKWLEAAAYALHHHEDSKLRARAAELIDIISAAQEPSGYLYTYYQLSHPDKRWFDLAAMHEIYCGGHLLEAGVAWKRLHKNDKILGVATKWADHLYETFGPEKRLGTCGHEEVELGLFALAGVTGDEKYADLAAHFLNQRGTRPSVFEQELKDPAVQEMSPWIQRLYCDAQGNYTGEYVQDHLPLAQHDKIVGHAVRAVYLYIGATDLAMKTGDEKLKAMLERVWENLMTRRVYVTGGLGPSSSNEGFTSDYDLPNLTAYAETCASVSLVFWAQKMFELTGNSSYIDSLERTLWNAAMSGISASGTEYFYDNPLESRANHARKPWFDCACCPPNIARMIGRVGDYTLAATEQALWINLPISCEFETVVKGVKVTGKIDSDYPWSGAFTLSLEVTKPVEFELRIRLPEWSEEIETDVPGLTDEADYDSGYAVFKKVWKSGDTARVDFSMLPTFLEANPLVRDNLGRVAVQRGPFIYCAEEDDDNKFAPQLFSIDTSAELEEKKSGDGVSLVAKGFREVDDEGGELYRELGSGELKEAELVLKPYHQWANGGHPANMQVWLRKS